jgi:hypothetical protein
LSFTAIAIRWFLAMTAAELPRLLRRQPKQCEKDRTSDLWQERNADATAAAANDVTSADAVENGLAGLRGVARTRFRV